MPPQPELTRHPHSATAQNTPQKSGRKPPDKQNGRPRQEAPALLTTSRRFYTLMLGGES